MSAETRQWAPLTYLTQPQKEKNIGLVILNRPLSQSQEKLRTLWKIASVTICVDGGANELYDVTKESERDKFLPQFVTGDFDSIKNDVLDYYKRKGAKIVNTPDQNHTDFTKALSHLISSCGDEQVEAIFVLGVFSGLLHHIMANINTLFEATEITDKPVILLSNDSLAFLLQPGKHKIYVNSGLEGSTCGLIPVGSKCESVTTTGLKWNLSNRALEFGKLVSTSNAFDGSSSVEIETSHPLLWTMEVVGS